MAELSQDQLRQLCEALGWQGGTFWQVLDEVKRLRSLHPHLSELLKYMEQFTNEMTVGERYSNAGQAALDSLPVLREAIAAAGGPPSGEARPDERDADAYFNGKDGWRNECP